MKKLQRIKSRVRKWWNKRRSKSAQAPTRAIKKTFVALYDYRATQPNDLTFRFGDLLDVDMSVSHVPEWKTARDINSGNTGLIPMNFVTDAEGYSLALDSWLNIGRSEAEFKLFLPGVQSGFFLLRPSSDPQSFALSVRNGDTGSIQVKHFKIASDPYTQTYYIQPGNNFKTLHELLVFHQVHPLGKNIFLTRPCPRNVAPPPITECEVDRSCVTLVEKVGQGNFGAVWRAKMGSVDVAVKTCFQATSRDEFLEEAKTMHQLIHPRLVRFLGICCRPETEPMYLITEFLSGGSLKNYLANADRRVVEYSWLLAIIHQVCTAMSFLEEVEVVHRDLRAANVLVAADKSVKVADFGLTKFLSNDPSKRIATSTFPVRWTAPESMRSNYKPSHKADVWSFGVLMFEVMTFASQPYAELSQDQILPFLQEGRRLPHPRTLGFRCDDNIYQTMYKCWSMQPEDRPDFKELEIGFETEISQEFGNFYGV